MRGIVTSFGTDSIPSSRLARASQSHSRSFVAPATSLFFTASLNFPNCAGGGYHVRKHLRILQHFADALRRRAALNQSLDKFSDAFTDWRGFFFWRKVNSHEGILRVITNTASDAGNWILCKLSLALCPPDQSRCCVCRTSSQRTLVFQRLNIRKKL